MPRVIRWSSRPLRIVNPFRSIGVLPFIKQHQRIIRGVIPNSNVSSSNALFQSVTGSFALPKGLRSLEEREKAQTVAEQIQMQRAGILSEKERKAKALAELAQKREQEQNARKMIQYLAENYDEDGVPPEYQEHLKVFLEKNEPMQAYYKEQFAKRAAKKAEKKAEKEAAQAVVQKQAETQEALAESKGSGELRTNYIFNMVSPFRRWDKSMAPRDIVENKQNIIEERRNTYRQEQYDAHGIPPPKEMVKRAIPDTAEPVKLSDPLGPGKIQIVPHPFILSRKPKIHLKAAGKIRRY